MRSSSLRLAFALIAVVVIGLIAWSGQAGGVKAAPAGQGTAAPTGGAAVETASCDVPAGQVATPDASMLSDAEKGDIKIGVAIALSGAAKPYAESQRKGLLLAQEIINKTGIDGKKIALLIRDTASDKAQATSVFQDFVNKDKVLAILGPTLSSEAAAAHVVAQDAKIPAMGMSNTGNGITDGKDFIFRDSLSEKDAIPNTIKVVKEKLNIKSVAIMYAQDDKFSSDGYAVFKAELDKNGIQILDTEVFSTADTDFSAPLTKIQGLDPQPDAIVITSLLGPAAKIIVKARELGLNQQIIGGNGFNTPLIIKATAGKAEGAIFGAAWSCSNSFPANVNFIKAYIAKWGEAPDQFSAQAATALQLLAVAMEDGKTTTDPKVLRDALAAVKDVDTPLGKFTFTADRNAQQATFVQTIKGGKFVLLEIVQ